MPDGEGSRRSLLDPHTLRRLFEQLEQTDVDEIEIVAGSSRVFIRREPGRRAALHQTAPALSAPPGVPVLAPLTGIFYSRATPADTPYAKEGDLVEAGQVVALIETMKIFNEIKAEVTGQVIQMMVQDGDLVEAGAPLLFIQPGMGENV
jgi:acetyl-CoA carboxylase biotin carboxyl carrier protein